MDFETFNPTDKEAAMIRETDSLVSLGIPRAKAESLTKQIFSLLDKHHFGLLRACEEIPDLVDRVMVKTCIVAFLAEWSSDVLLPSGIAQAFCIQQLATEEPDHG